MPAFLWTGWDGDQYVSAVNAIFALFAAVTNTWAATNSSRWLRKMFMTIAALAFFYGLAYIWLVLNPDRVMIWSNTLRPIGILTWVVAWGIEPIIIVKHMKSVGRKVERDAARRADEARMRLDATE